MRLWKVLTIALLADLMAAMPLAGVVLADTTPSPSDPFAGASASAEGHALQCTAPEEFSGATNEADLLDGRTVAPAADETDPTEGAPDPSASPSPQALAPTSTTQTLADVPAVTLADTTPSDITDPGEGSDVPFQSINLDDLKQNPFFNQADFDAFVSTNHGWFDSATNRWDFCTFEGMDNINAIVPNNLDLVNYLNKLDNPYDQLTFTNPLDKYALTGEPCSLFDPRTSLCDETKVDAPVTDINGNPILDTNGQPLTEKVPKYYDDSIWPNGQWDAPKADQRILKTLDYLITPKSRGGAGREHIKISEILQPGQKSKETLTGNASGTGAGNLPTSPTPSNTATSSSVPTTSTSNDSASTPSAAATQTPESSGTSSHYYDTQHPGNPLQIASGVDISEIDNVRITTKIVQKHRIGGDTTTYQYKQIPLKVAWQTDSGAQTANLVGPNLYQAALSNFSTGLAGLLDSMDLQATFDLNNVKDLNSLGDVATLIGQSLITQLLNSPNGSLNGWDLGSVLEGIGRTYLAEQLGLPNNAFSSGTTAGDLIQTVGRTTVEQAFHLPQDSLAGATSAEVFANLGRREMEDVLGVSEGTLLPYGQFGKDAFLERIGAGKIEARFRLPQGSMQTASWSSANSTVKTKYLFTKGTANFDDEALNLAFQPLDGQSVDSFGYVESDFAAPTADFLSNASDAAFAKYKRLVGARAIEAGIGKFSATTSSYSASTSQPQVQNFVRTMSSSFGYHFYPSLNSSAQIPPSETQIYSGKIDGSFTPWIITIDNNSPVRGVDGVFSDTDLVGLGQKLLSANISNTYGIGCLPKTFPNTCSQDGSNPFQTVFTGLDTQAKATSIYNALQTYWQPLLQTALTNTEENMRMIEQAHSDSQSKPYEDARTAISTALGQVRSYSDGILIAMNANGQSGRSAALGLPGNFQQVNMDGTLTGDTLYNTDPANAFINGNDTIELMTLMGKAYAAQAMTTDLSAQQKFISQIKSDASTFNTLTQYGIDVNSWISKGFSADDFDRIFTKNLGPQVFSRIGEQQLLGSLWGKTDLNNVIKDALGNTQANTIVNQVGQIAQGIAFYTDLFKQLQTVTAKLIADADAAGALTPDIKRQLQTLNSSGSLTSIDSVRDTARSFEPLVAVITSGAAIIKNDIAQEQFILREIAAGQPLNFNQSASGNPTPTQGVAIDGCFQPSQFRDFFQSKGNLVQTFANQVAGCRVDDALGIPFGSTYAWYNGHDYSIDAFSLDIGRQYAKASSTSLADDAARAYGRQLLEGAALNKVFGSIPGIAGNLKKLGLNGASLIDLLNGRGEQVLARMGGSMMDNFFDWKPGTGAQLVLPRCTDDTGKVTDCTRDQATNIRVETLASLGLKDLGISLSFPSTLDLFPAKSSPLGGFDFATSFGIARISENFGLKPNTFYGSFNDVRGRNAPQPLLTGLGWYQTPGVRALNAIATELKAAGVGLTADQNTIINQIADGATSLADDISNSVLDEITKPTSQIWVDGQEAAIASTMSSDEQNRFQKAIAGLNALVAEYQLDGLTSSKLTQVIAANSNPSFGTSDNYKAQVIGFKTRVKGLDGQYGLDVGTFQSFITGSIKAEDIANKEATRELTNVLADTVVNKLLAGTPFENLPETFQVLSKTANCPSGATIADFLLNTSGKTAAACTIKNISLHDIFTGKDVNDQSKRAFLYDNFLARAFGQKLEKDLKLEPGTIRAIIIQPWRAKEIAIDQGIRLLGAQLFKLTGADGLSADPSKKLIRALDGALLAGFCPVDPLSIQGDAERALVASTDKLCTLNFNGNRSFVVLKQNISALLQERFEQNGFDGTKISLVDLAPIMIGGLQGAYFLGAATLADNLNKQLGDSPKASAFKIQYNDIRNAFGQFTFTSADYKVFEQNSQYEFALSYYNCYDLDTYNTDPACQMSKANLIQTFLNDNSNPDMSPADRLLTMTDLSNLADKTAPSTLKQRAINRLQYNLYDIIAYKVDPDIPRGFSYIMLQGSSQQKFQMVEYYLVNKLNLGTSVFGGALTNDMVDSLLNYVQSGFKGGVNLDAVNALDGWLTKESEKLFGFTLPAGTVQGIFAWGSTGFKGKYFDSSHQFDVGGKLFSPVGTVLKDWGISKLLGWADKSFGWQPGSAFQIYQAASDVIRASQFLRYAQTTIGQAKDLAHNTTVMLKVMQGDPNPGKMVNSQADARANLKAAQAALIAVVINIVFASQIGAAEKGLGLVPGTGALGITMLVQLAMGVPVDPITLGLFVAINLFGAYAVEVSVRATVDGYYPFTGKYGVARVNPQEYISPDPASEDFDAMNPISYRAGIEHGAQFKVNQLIQDILRMPTRWAAATGDDPNNLYAEQVFTDREEDVSSLDSLISAPAPWDKPPGWGYGPLSERATVVYNNQTGAYEAKPDQNYRAGVFADDTFSDHIHIRF